MTKARDIASAAPAPAGVTSTELGFVDGVTSALQTQIDSKIGSAAAINPTIVDAKGDIIAATAADTVARLAVGANNTVLTADSATATGLKWAAAAGGGKVLQVVSTTKTDTFTKTSASYEDITGLSVTITPSAATSKILVMVALNGSGVVASSFANYQIVRDSTAIAIGDTAGSRVTATGILYGSVTGVTSFGGGNFLDSPSSTSALTYKVQLGINTAGNAYINRAATDTDSANFTRMVSSITVMEIGA
jgi:hypothetical protein